MFIVLVITSALVVVGTYLTAFSNDHGAAGTQDLGSTIKIAAAPVAPRSFCDDDAYAITWRDEFDGPELDASKWTVVEDNNREWLHFGYGRSALPRRNNVMVQDGSLVLECRREKVLNYSYTTGAVDTRTKAAWSKNETHRVCIRAKIPGIPDPKNTTAMNQGYWPALWMLPLPANGKEPCESDLGEIDIFEMVDGNTRVEHTYHWQKNYPPTSCEFPNNHGSRTTAWVLPDFDQDYHEYAVERTPDILRYVVDGVVRLEIANDPTVPLFDVPYYVIMNFALGGTWPGPPIPATYLPAQFKIDYVRVAHLKSKRSGLSRRLRSKTVSP